jgi:hypothetical protein
MRMLKKPRLAILSAPENYHYLKLSTFLLSLEVSGKTQGIDGKSDEFLNWRGVAL